MSGNERAGVFDALKTVLSSPVGGWALAVVVVGYMAWLTIEDRHTMYLDLKSLRETAMPIITNASKLAFENQKTIAEIKALAEQNHNLLLEIRRNQIESEKALQ